MILPCVELRFPTRGYCLHVSGLDLPENPNYEKFDPWAVGSSMLQEGGFWLRANCFFLVRSPAFGSSTNRCAILYWSYRFIRQTNKMTTGGWIAQPVSATAICFLSWFLHFIQERPLLISSARYAAATALAHGPCPVSPRNSNTARNSSIPLYAWFEFRLSVWHPRAWELMSPRGCCCMIIDDDEFFSSVGWNPYCLSSLNYVFQFVHLFLSNRCSGSCFRRSTI